MAAPSSQFSSPLVKTTYDPETKTWSGPKIPPLYHPNASLGQIVLSVLSKYPNEVGQVCHEDGNEMLNWEIHRDSVRVTLSLKDLGLVEGDVVGFAAGNSRHVAAVIFGSLLLGAPVSTLDPSFLTSDIVHIFKGTQPKIVFCDLSNFSRVKSALEELESSSPIYVFNQENEEITEGGRTVEDLLKPQKEELNFVPPALSNGATLPAFILCSSGTTGSPKSIPISHASLAYGFQRPVSVPPSTRFFSFSSLYWMSGLSLVLMTTLGNKTRIIVREPYSESLFLDIVKKRKVGVVICTPAQLQRLLLRGFDEKEDLKSLMMIFCGGSAVPKSLVEKFKVPVLNGYGMTEVAGITVQGQLSPGMQLKIIDENGEKLGPGEGGEICCKPFFPFLGYHGNEEATKTMLIDGFCHSGDIGIVDDNGNVSVVDRKKDIFKFNNFHVNPTDIERELAAVDGVALVTVVGIPDPVFATLPAAVIVAKEGSKLTEEEIHRVVKEKLSHFKWLRGGVYFVDELPMTPSGKILRREVLKIAKEMYEKRPGIGFVY